MAEHQMGISSFPRRQLPPSLQLHILSLLPPNERALTGRLVNRDAAEFFGGAGHLTASLSQPLPPHALPWAAEAVQQHARQLPFRRKLQLMSTAAASGSELNLEAVISVVQSSIFPELLRSNYIGWRDRFPFPDPGEAAIRAIQPQLLGWLVRHCPGLLRPHSIVEAAALYLDCAGLQAVWEDLQAMPDSSDSISLHQPLLLWLVDKAASTTAPDGLSKLQWTVGVAGSNYFLQASTVLHAAWSGDLSRLQWLRSRGVRMDVPRVLQCALCKAGVEVVCWLVDDAGCRLPAAGSGDGDGAGDGDGGWGSLLKAAATAGSDGVVKLQWLQERGAPLLMEAAQDMLLRLTEEAACAGRVETVGYLLWIVQQRFGGVPQGALSGDGAAGSGSIPTAVCMRQAGCVLTVTAYHRAVQKGDLAMVRWLAEEAGVSATDLSLSGVMLDDDEGWPCDTAAHSRDLLQAMRVLLAAGAEARQAWITLYSATRRGDLALVQYLQQEVLSGIWHADGKSVDAAAASGCEALVELLAGQPESIILSPYVEAAVHGDLATLRALRRLGVPWGEEDSLAEAVERGCTEPALRWLAEQGVPVGAWTEMEEIVWRVFTRYWFEYDAGTVEWLRSLATAG